MNNLAMGSVVVLVFRHSVSMVYAQFRMGLLLVVVLPLLVWLAQSESTKYASTKKHS